MRKFIIRLAILGGVLLLVLIAGVIGFMLLESLSPFDALYFTITTVATVGFRDISPHTIGGRILTIFIIVIGVGTFTAFIVNIGTLIWERRELKVRNERMHMLIGLFLSQLGNRLLEIFSMSDPDINLIP
jgi:voltage-gated potassium channel